MKNNSTTILLVILTIILGCLCVLFATGVITFNYTSNDNNNNNNNNLNNNNSNNEQINTTLSENEAINIGKQLYDKATEIYSVWVLFPYCGYDVTSDTADLKIEQLGNSANGNSEYYESEFASLDELKNYLKNYLSEDIINDKVKESYQLNGETYYKYVTDTSLLSSTDSHYSYIDYVLKDNKLYCRLQSGKGWLNTKYLDEYSLKVSNIDESKITFTVTSTYINDDTLQNSETSCNNQNPTNCTDKDKEYKDSEFVIEKVNDNWIVTSFTLHE